MRSDIGSTGQALRSPLHTLDSQFKRHEQLRTYNGTLLANALVARSTAKKPKKPNKRVEESTKLSALACTIAKPILRNVTTKQDNTNKPPYAVCHTHNAAQAFSSTKEENKYSLTYLIRSLNSDGIVQRLTALRLLPGALKDATLADQAVSLDIVEKATLLYRRFWQGLLKKQFQEESMLLKIFLTLSGYPKACTQMAEKSFLIKELYRYILDMHSEQNVAASILCNISAEPEAVKALVTKNNVLESIHAILEREMCKVYYPKELWRHIAHVLDEAPEQGVAANLMPTFMDRIKYRIVDFNGYNTKCLALLLKDQTGQKAFEAVRGMRVLYELLSPNTPKLDNYEYILLALRNAIESDTLFQQCVDFEDLADILTNLAKTTENGTEQIYCFDIVSKLIIIKKLQTVIHERCMQELSLMKCLSKEAENARLQLVRDWAKLKMEL